MQHLIGRTSYPQRSPEWYEIRDQLITASDAASALNIKPYEGYRQSPREELMKRKVSKKSSSSQGASSGMNPVVLHGIKYEDEARQKYCERTGEEVVEFGLLVHPDYPWLGASPDGVTKSGKLIEIKCPMTRTIVPGEVPHHYMPQVQVCLEVCNLEEAVFIQYKPESITWPRPAILDIAHVKRDREWFCKNMDLLHGFWKEMMERRETYQADSPETAKPVRPGKKVTMVCQINDMLYDDSMSSEKDSMNAPSSEV